MAAGRSPEESRSRIFISYRRTDTAHAVGRIHDRLETHFGEGIVFRDVDDIPVGANFRERLDEALDDSAVVLVVIGPRWLAQSDPTGHRRVDDPEDVVRIEVEAALNSHLIVIPLLVGDGSMPQRDELPEELQPLVDRNGLAIRPDPDFSGDVRRLITAIGPAVAAHHTAARVNAPRVDRQRRGAFLRSLPRSWRGLAGIAAVVAVLGMALGTVWFFGVRDENARATSIDGGGQPDPASTSPATHQTPPDTSASSASGSTFLNTTFVVTADPSLEDAVDPVGTDLAFTRSFSTGVEDESVDSESRAIAIYCEGFDVGAYQALTAQRYGGAVVPACGDIPYPNVLPVLSHGEAWCQGFVGGVDAAHRQLKDALLDIETGVRISETCRVRRWWTEVETST